MNGKVDRSKVIDQAERYVRAGKLREGILEYEKLLEEDPTDVSINNIIGDLYVRINQTNKAIKAFENVASEYEKKSLYSQALAILKKICRLNPEKPEYFIKMADLYTHQGFTAEAKQEYVRIAQKYLRAKKMVEGIEIYEKIVRLDKDDVDARIQLAALYKQDGRPERAVNELLEASALKMELGMVEEAERLLKEARKLSPDNVRVNLRLAQILRLKDQSDKAMSLAEAALEKNPNDLDALTFLGNVYYEEGKLLEAKEVFIKVLNYYPLNINARYKLGRINLAEGDVEKCFEYFEPLVDSYIKKRKDEKAWGLLGLILTVQKDHLPSMEKLASVLRGNKDLARLEAIDLAILEELKKIGEKTRMLSYCAELIRLRPTDEKLAREYRELKKELVIGEEEETAYESVALSKEEEEEIQAGLAQADVYIQEGLARLGRRVIENLLIKYPNDPLIKQKLNYIDSLKTTLSEEELLRRVEKASAIESQVIRPGKTRPAAEKEAKKETEFQLKDQVLSEDKISPVDIFTDTGLAPIIATDTREKKFYDLQENIRSELAMLSAIFLRQKKGITTQFEKELSTIVQDFKKGVREKIPEEDFQIHLQLGLAFMEQGLLDDAIEEFNLASKDKNLTLECLTLISHCYRLKSNVEEAERWLNRAIKLVQPGTDQYFALLFDLGLTHEQAGDYEKALTVYRDIQSWNPAYRSVTDKIIRLSNMTGTSGSSFS
jgi:tetratricopeptide (TPR) repeat protein